jgi:hypothetical protein
MVDIAIVWAAPCLTGMGPGQLVVLAGLPGSQGQSERGLAGDRVDWSQPCRDSVHIQVGAAVCGQPREAIVARSQPGRAREYAARSISASSDAASRERWTPVLASCTSRCNARQGKRRGVCHTETKGGLQSLSRGAYAGIDGQSEANSPDAASRGLRRGLCWRTSDSWGPPMLGGENELFLV